MDAELRSSFLEAKGRRATVLVVDDSPDIRRYLTLALEIDHYKVETASSGEEAFQRLRDGCAAAIVLLDLQMPGMDGLETLHYLRQLRPDLKVIMCSAVEDPEVMEQAARLGAQAYLVKPVQQLYLSAAVERCLRAGCEKSADQRLKTEVLAMVPPALRPK